VLAPRSGFSAATALTLGSPRHSSLGAVGPSSERHDGAIVLQDDRRQAPDEAAPEGGKGGEKHVGEEPLAALSTRL